MTLIRDTAAAFDLATVMPEKCHRATSVPDRPCCLARTHRGKTACLPYPSRWAVTSIDADNPRYRPVPLPRRVS